MRDKVHIALKAFGPSDLEDRELVLRMLRHEDAIHYSELGQDIHRNPYNGSLVSLAPRRIVERMVLTHFGFTTDEESLTLYTQIFRHYCDAGKGLDEEIMNSVYYLRHNLCLRFRSPELKVGDRLPNCTTLLDLQGNPSSADLHTLVKAHGHTMICAFSSS